MATSKTQARECGLYRATKPLPGHEDKVPAGTLIYFHNHSTTNGPLPSVIPPDHNVHNRWHFHQESAIDNVRSPSWVDSLEKLPDQNFYTLRRELDLRGRLLAQGRDRAARLHQDAPTPSSSSPASAPSSTENDLYFSDKGVGIKRDQLNILEPAAI